MISQIASKPDAKRVTLPKTLKAESVGYFEAGRRGQKRSLLGVNEHFAHKPDAKRVTLYAFTTAGLHKVLLNKPIEIAIHNRLYG